MSNQLQRRDKLGSQNKVAGKKHLLKHIGIKTNWTEGATGVEGERMLLKGSQERMSSEA